MASATDTGTLTYAQLKGVWLQASQGTRYHTNMWASLMAAIAEAESSGDPLAYNPTDNNGTQTSWGLWQISNGTHNPVSPNWADPTVNARLAIGKLETQGLTAWGTYDSGAYRAYLSDKTAADTAELTSAEPDSVTQAAATAAATAGQTCAWKVGLGNIDPSLFGYHPVGTVNLDFCVLSKSQARALIGVAVATAGAVIIAGGVVLLTTAAGLSVLTKLAAPIAGLAGGAGTKAASATASTVALAA